MTRKFSNHRQWREFVAAVHESVSFPCVATYPMVLSALRSGRVWFNVGAARASTWLSGGVDCASDVNPERSHSPQSVCSL